MRKRESDRNKHTTEAFAPWVVKEPRRRRRPRLLDANRAARSGVPGRVWLKGVAHQAIRDAAHGVLEPEFEITENWELEILRPDGGVHPASRVHRGRDIDMFAPAPGSPTPIVEHLGNEQRDHRRAADGHVERLERDGRHVDAQAAVLKEHAEKAATTLAREVALGKAIPPSASEPKRGLTRRHGELGVRGLWVLFAFAVMAEGALLYPTMAQAFGREPSEPLSTDWLSGSFSLLAAFAASLAAIVCAETAAQCLRIVRKEATP